MSAGELNKKEVLNRAIGKEQEAFEIYREMSMIVENPESKKLFLELAVEEEGHKKLLEEFLETREDVGSGAVPYAEGILDYLSEVPGSLEKENDPQAILLFALGEEKRAWQFYSDWETRVDDPALGEVLKKLAREELNHRQRLEGMYEKEFMPEN